MTPARRASDDQTVPAPTPLRRAGDPPASRYTLEELEEASDVPQRTIRFYRQSGLIDPPQREGRRVFYGPEALERLRTISQLRERGLGLEAVHRILEDPSGAQHSLTELLRVGDELRKPWIEDRAAVMTRLEVLETLGVDQPGAIEILEHYRVITRTASKRPVTYTVPSVATLELAGDMTAAGVSPELIHEAWAVMQERLSQLAHELMALFTESVVQVAMAPAATARDEHGGDAGEEPPITLDDLMAGFARLRPIALDAVRLSFGHEIERALEEFVEEGRVIELKAQLRDKAREVGARPRPGGTRSPSKPAT